MIKLVVSHNHKTFLTTIPNCDTIFLNIITCGHTHVGNHGTSSRGQGEREAQSSLALHHNSLLPLVDNHLDLCLLHLRLLIPPDFPLTCPCV